MNKIIQKINEEFDEKKLIDNVISFCSKKTVNPPGDEYLLNKEIIKIFEEIGCQDIDLFEKEKGRSNLVGRLKGKGSGPVIAIVGHTDVVPTEGQRWDSDPFEPVIKDGKIFARGAIDNKGPFASVLEGIRIFNKLTEGDFGGELIIISAADEESGSDLGIKYLFEEIGLVCDYALIPDGGDFEHAIFGEMGILQLEISTEGKAYHGSIPELGINAIAPLAKLYLALYETNWADIEGDGEFENAVLNLGIIKGGTAPNIVPEFASFNAMWRYPLAKKGDEKLIDEKILEIVEEKIGEARNQYPEVKFKHSLIHKSKPYLGDKNSSLFLNAIKCAKDMALKIPTLKTIRAETVGKYINQACGAEILVNGPMDGSLDLMHQANEYIEISELSNFAKYYAYLLFMLQK
ncbi:M20 family metallopeptidase [Candidatus Dojkabacteria bacterium]|nr:M20 family metallopeptidase [Candidatus Dojkabacteria bacterium]